MLHRMLTFSLLAVQLIHVCGTLRFIRMCLSKGKHSICTRVSFNIRCSCKQYVYTWFQLTLPLVEGLRSTAIRPRHWKQVLRYASSSSLSSSHLVSRGGGLDSSVLDSLTLSQLMALELHGQWDNIWYVCLPACVQIYTNFICCGFKFNQGLYKMPLVCYVA